MRMEKFTIKAQEAIQEGQSLARRASHPNYEPEHLAKALLAQEDGIAIPILQKVGADVRLLTQRIDEALTKQATIKGGAGATLSQRLLSTFDKAEDQAKALKDEFVSSEHLLLALASDKGSIGEVFKASGITRDRLLAVLKEVR